MGIVASYVTDDMFVIKEEEYGGRFCHISFTGELTDALEQRGLTSWHLQQLADKFASGIAEILQENPMVEA